MRHALLLASALTVLPLIALELRPCPEPVLADRLIVRLRFAEPARTFPTLQGRLEDADFRHNATLSLLNPVSGHPEADYEFSWAQSVTLSAECRVTLDGLPAGATVTAIIPARLAPHDLSRGIDVETPESSGLWLASLGASVATETGHPFRGQRSMAATWTGSDMVTFLPGERDWTPYAELRFVVSNPLPPPDGTRDRNLFLFDGRMVHRPTPQDSIPQGNILVPAESSREFRLDLIRLRANNPQIDLQNMRALQFFWSSTPAPGATTFTFDEIRLLTAAQLQQETEAGYRSQFAQIDGALARLPAGQAPWQLAAQALKDRFQQGERDTLTHDIRLLQEELLNATLLVHTSPDLPFRPLAAAPTEKVHRHEPFAHQELPWRLTAAGNERESFQLVLAPTRPLRQVLVTAGPLRGSDGALISPECVRINPVGYVEVTEAFFYPTSRTGFWPDILHENRPFDLPCRVQPFMVTVAVPAGQAAGLYQGTVQVSAAGLEPRSLPYELLVYPFTLPTRGAAKVLFTANYVPEDRNLRRKVYDLLFDYRTPPTSMYTRIHRHGPNRFIPDFEDIPYCLEKGMNILFFGEILDRPARDPHAFSPEYIQAVLDWIGHCRPLLQQLGAWDIAYLNGFDEIMHRPAPVTARRLREAEEILGRIRQAYPDCKIANVGKLMQISSELMDQWFCSPIPSTDFQPLAAAGGQIGFYWVYQNPSFMLDLPGLAPRLCSWLAFKHKTNGIAYYSTSRPHHTGVGANQIPASATHTPGSGICHEQCLPQPPSSLDWDHSQFDVRGTQKFARNGDGVLFYPAPDRSLMASLRMVAIRDGIEDFEYLALLAALAGNGHPLLNIPDSLVTLRDYTQDVTLVQAYREQVAQAIVELVSR